MNDYQVSSEIFTETDFGTSSTSEGKVLSRFPFTYPNDCDNTNTTTDKDGDLEVHRPRKGVIIIEHLKATKLELVGLQVWRGALLLADFVLHLRNELKNKLVLELGSGVGLTSIAAGIYSKEVICTDIAMGGILEVIKSNLEKNSSMINAPVTVHELDFKATSFTPELSKKLSDVEIFLAADVIYDDDLTEAFVGVLEKLLQPTETVKQKTLYMALEKRYVFTVTDLDIAPPCYDTFLKLMDRVQHKHKWTFRPVPIDFPQYFQYERVKELLLLKIST